MEKIIDGCWRQTIEIFGRIKRKGQDFYATNMEPTERLLALQGLIKTAYYPRYQAEIPKEFSGVSLECLKSAVFDACDDHCILTDVPSEYREFSGILRVVYWQECWNN